MLNTSAVVVITSLFVKGFDRVNRSSFASTASEFERCSIPTSVCALHFERLPAKSDETVRNHM